MATNRQLHSINNVIPSTDGSIRMANGNEAMRQWQWPWQLMSFPLHTFLQFLRKNTTSCLLCVYLYQFSGRYEKYLWMMSPFGLRGNKLMSVIPIRTRYIWQIRYFVIRKDTFHLRVHLRTTMRYMWQDSGHRYYISVFLMTNNYC